MKRQIILFTLAAVAFCIASCTKDGTIDVKPLGPLLIPQEMKDYVYFLPGSYWVYEEQSSGIIDSVYLLSAGTGMDSSYLGHNNRSYDRLFEWLAVELKSSRDSFIYKYGVHASWAAENCRYLCFRSKSKPGNFVGETIMFFYRSIIGLKIGTWNATGSITTPIDILDSITINNDTFYKVLKVNETVNITEDRNETNFYLGAYKGIIKKELIDSSKVWNLLRYNIVQ